MSESEREQGQAENVKVPFYKDRSNWFVIALLVLIVAPIILIASFKSLHSAWSWFFFAPVVILFGYALAKNRTAKNTEDHDAASQSNDPNVVDAEVVDDPDQTGPIDYTRRTPRNGAASQQPPETSERRLVTMSLFKENKPFVAFVALGFLAAGAAVWFSLYFLANWSKTSATLAVLIPIIAVAAIAVAVAWFLDRRKTASTTEETPTKLTFGNRARTYVQSAPRPGKRAGFAGAGALIVLAFIAVFFLGKATTAPNGQVVAAAPSVSQEQLTELQNKMNDLQNQLNSANDKLASQPVLPAVDNSVKSLTEGERVVLSALEAQGIDPNSVRLGTDINIDWAKKVSAGGTTFGEAIYTPADVVKLLKSDTPEAKAALANLRGTTKASDAELQNVANWTEVQYTTPIQWNGNTFYVSGRAVDGGSKVDPAGSVGIYYTGPQTIQLVSSEGKLDPKNLFGFRGACANPQIAPPTPPTGGGNVPPTYGPPSPPTGGGNPPPPPVNPPPPPTGGCEEPNGCVPPPCTENCTPPPCETDCTPPPCTENCVPPCEENPEGPGCTPPPCEENCTPPCEENPEGPDCQPEPEKCEGVEEGKPCGTPDTGGEQQPVQDNDPELVQPTPGYTPGDAEDTLENQGPNCTLTNTCGTDSTEDGTQAGEGGTSPGNGAGNVIPGGDAGVNPDADGEAPDAGTDAGTGNDAGSEEAQTEGSGDTSGQGDPFAGMPLPNVESAPAPAAPAAAPAYVAPAVAESTYVAPVEQSGSTQSVYEDTSSYSTPADTSVSSFSASDQSSSSSASDTSSSFDSSASSTLSSSTSDNSSSTVDSSATSATASSTEAG